MTNNFFYGDIAIECAIPESLLLEAMELYNITARRWDIKDGIQYVYITYNDRISKYSFSGDRYMEIINMAESSEKVKCLIIGEMEPIKEYFQDIMYEWCTSKFELKLSYIEFI